MPPAGAAIVIPADRTVVLDQNVELGSLVINGALVFADKDLSLSATSILVRGRLTVGTAASPYTRRGTITLTGASTGPSPAGFGNKFLGVDGNGVLDIHGEVNRTPWTQLAATANVGSSQITVLNAQGWRVGDKIAVAPSDFEPREHEQRLITAISGTTLTLDKPLAYRHWGEVEQHAGQVLDMRAEVALLSRNIVLTSDAAAYPAYGGHIMAMGKGTVRIDGAEIT